MTKDDVDSWLEGGKLIASIAMPIVVATIGILMLRRIEAVKSLVVKESEFHKKWAEEFFEACQRFLQTLERELALLTTLSTFEDANGRIGTALQEEISTLHPLLSELELRIRRCVVFAPSTGTSVTSAAHACITRTGKLVAQMKGNVDDIITKMNEFNIASRNAHAEMLGLSYTSKRKQSGT